MTGKVSLGSALGLILIISLIGGINCEKKKCPIMKTLIDCMWKAVKDADSNTNKTVSVQDQVCKSVSGGIKYKKCLDNVKLTDMKACFTLTEVFQVDDNVKMMKKGATFWCDEDGKNLKTFIDGGGMNCIKVESKVFEETCNSTMITEYAHTTKDKEFCKLQGSSMGCIVNQTLSSTSCSKKTQDVVKTFFDVVRKESPCSSAYTFHLSAFAILIALMLHLTDYAAPKST